LILNAAFAKTPVPLGTQRTVRIAGADITFTSTHAIDSILDSCGKAQYVDPAPTGTTTYAMTLEQDQTGSPMLHLRLPTGEDVVLGR
jgi:hypothetical protein